MYICTHTYFFFFSVLWVIIFVPAKSEQVEQLQISQKLLESRQQPTHQAAWREKLDMMKFRCVFLTENCSLGSRQARVNQGAMRHRVSCHWLYCLQPCIHNTRHGQLCPSPLRCIEMVPGETRGRVTNGKIAFGFQDVKRRSWEHLLHKPVLRITLRVSITSAMGPRSLEPLAWRYMSHVSAMFQQHIQEVVAYYSNRPSSTTTYP